MTFRLLLLCAFLFLALPAGAQGPAPAPTLKAGDPAPPITIDTWVKGDPVPALVKGTPYIVEFWATWCGPCRQTIPHLTELQARYKDRGLKIIGISSSERKGLADVQPFVANMGAKMDYTVAWDRNGITNRAWMAAAGQSGIPTAFVVDKQGRVAWIGHPMNGLDRVVEQVVAGTYDIAAAELVRRKVKDVETRMQQANQARDLGKLAGLMDELMALDPSRFDQAAAKKLEILLFGLHRYDEGYAWAAELVDQVYQDRADMLNAIAWAIADGPGLERRDLDLALRASQRALALTKGEDMDVLDTLARVQFARGQIKEAVATQEKAVAMAFEPKKKSELQGRLDKYKAAR